MNILCEFFVRFVSLWCSFRSRITSRIHNMDPRSQIKLATTPVIQRDPAYPGLRPAQPRRSAGRAYPPACSKRARLGPSPQVRQLSRDGAPALPQPQEDRSGGCPTCDQLRAAEEIPPQCHAVHSTRKDGLKAAYRTGLWHKKEFKPLSA
jgi:hypothetical protein